MKTVTVQELKEMQEKKVDFQLIDVREPLEFEESNLGGELIPMGSVLDHLEQISKDKQVVVHCRSGKRSANVIALLEAQFGYDNLYNLTGGIMAYQEAFGNE